MVYMKKMTAYSPYEIYTVKLHHKMPDGSAASKEQVKEAAQLLDAIDYRGFYRKLVSLEKKELKGKLTAEEAKLFQDMQERNIKAYWRMKRWFVANEPF